MADRHDHRQLIEQLQQRLAAAQQVRRELAELVGHGESGDGLIRVEYTDADGLAALTINPRSMRLDSTSLAEQIMAATRAARLDLQARKHNVAGAEFAPEALADPVLLRSQLNDAAATFQRTSSDVSAVLDLLRRATSGGDR